MLTWIGFLIKHNETKSLNALEKLPSKTGGLAFGIRNKTLIGWYSDNGGSPFANSIAVIPSDHISAYYYY